MDLRQRHPFWIVVAIAAIIALARFPEFLLAVALAYMAFGVFFRITYSMKRRRNPQVGAPAPDIGSA